MQKKHKLIFIHGMGEGSSQDAYDDMLFNLTLLLSAESKTKFIELFEPVFVHWHDKTAQGEELVFKRAFPQFEIPRHFTSLEIFSDLNRAARYFITYFIGDVVAYTDENDNGIRKAVQQELLAHCADAPYSIIAHSLGSVIAFDFLYYLFAKNQFFYPTNSTSTPSVVKPYQENFRNFFTMGSPIGLFFMRKSDLWKDNFNNLINPVSKHWLNFYHPYDPIAYPLQGFFASNTNNPKTLRDIEVDTGSLLNSHTGYWENMDVAKKIAKILSVSEV
ncbi:MAG: hypothetical protein SFU91_14865 [Chloroherpetonaceae bacterium]|nr:hypothetical protein [Chloroherpetonaceae bacterium]